MPIEAGKLRHRLTVEQDTGTDVDSAGAHLPDWTTYATDVWCSIEPASGSEPFYAGAFNPDVSHRIELRYLEGLVPTTMRFVWGDRVFWIVSVLNEGERDEKMIVAATEIVL